MKNLIIILLVCISQYAKAQIQSIKINNWNVEYYIPSSNATKLPAVIFFPGNGEVGFDKNKLYVHGPMRFIRDAGWRPNHIVVACQFPQGWANETVVQTFLDTLITKYKVDPNCFFLTGLSGGAYSIWNYIRNAAPEKFRKPKGIIPFSYSWTAGANDERYINIKQWLFCGWYDSFYGNAFNWHNYINANYNNNSRFTTYKLPIGSGTQNQSGHCCWNTYYDPNYRENGKNIYEWAISQCNTALNLPNDSTITRVPQRLGGFVITTEKGYQVLQRGTLFVYNSVGQLIMRKQVRKGEFVQRKQVQEFINFIIQ